MFSAIVSGTSDLRVKWSVSSGTITSDGVFTPPEVSTKTTVEVTATSYADRTATGKLSVTISPHLAPSVLLFRAVDSSISPGEATTLQWHVHNANRIEISQIGRISAEGSREVAPMATTDYTLTAEGPGGTTTAATRVTVSQQPPATTRTLTVSVSGAGRVSSSPAGINNCSGVCSATFNDGQFVTLTSTPGSGASFSGWGGACYGTGSTCTATMSADKQVTAAFAGSGSQGGPYTIKNQQPSTAEFYPGTLWTTPLPANVDQHILGNSNSIVNNVWSGDIMNNSTVITRTSNQGGYGGQAFHYASSADPVYKVVSAEHVPKDPLYSPLGKYFHLPKGLCYDGGSNADQFLLVWDQSTEIDSTRGGRFFVSYHFSGTPPCISNTCACATASCANNTSTCQLNLYYAEIGFPFNDPQPWQHAAGAYVSGSWPGPTGFLRGQEIVDGVVNHALQFGTYCLKSSWNGSRWVADPPVFPAYGNARACEFADANRLTNGNWVYLDSGYDCNSLPVWQRAVCRALQTYGGAVHDTGGSDHSGVSIARHENPDAYSRAGIRMPLLNWFRQFTNFGGGAGTWTGENGLVVYTDSSGNATRVDAPFLRMPGALQHIHIANPCIAKAMAGLSPAQGACY